MKLDFNDKAVFARLEDEAIDGRLNYNGFPPEEYKYFSKLAKLGHMNRYKGWSVEICEKKQAEFKADYLKEKERSGFVLREMKRVNELRVKCGQAVSAVYKAKTESELYGNMVTALEALLDEPGLENRIRSKLGEFKNDKQS